jgi:hypothetical protein
MSETGHLHIHCRMHGIGLGPGSSNNWDDYEMSPVMREALGAVSTPSAYKALHFQEGSFEEIYDLRKMEFKNLTVFKFHQSNARPEPTEFQEITEVTKDVETYILHDTRPYRRLFDLARTMVERNRRAAIHCRRTGNTQEIDLLAGMAFASKIEILSDETPARITVSGFYPYFCTRDEDNESIFIFFHVELNRLVMAAARNRQYALNLILKHGRLHTFDKTCAYCGKTGDLRKCKCKGVRYCSRECQLGHWTKHRVECRK